MQVDNSVCLVDGEIIDKYPKFTSKLLKSISPHSLFIVVAEQHLSEEQLNLKDRKNVALIFDNF